jgi:hypothetical protein
MTLAGFLVEIRARAGVFGEIPSSPSPQIAITTLVGLGTLNGAEGAAVRRVLTAFAHSHTAPTFDQGELEALGPLAIGALDCLVEALMDGRYSGEALRDALRPLLLRSAQ